MRFLSTAGMAHQFIKHGNIFINYKKITHPLFVVKPGDTVSIFIRTLTFHRFYDPTLTFRLCQGLYRKNTGRRSPATLEPHYSFVKSGLNNFSKLERIDNSSLRKNLVSVVTKKKFLLKRPR
jgi:ribosomal protein S4